MNQKENTVLLVYRVIGDRRIPYHFELDASMTVVADRPNIELLQAQALAERQSLTLQVDQPNATVNDHLRQVQSMVNRDLQPNETVVNQLIQAEATEQAQAPAENEDVETLIRKAIQEGHVVRTTDPTLLKKYPELAPATPPELAPGMKGETIEEILPNGVTQRVYKPTPADIIMGTWVTDIVPENPIPGTDDLRAEYFAEIEQLKARHAQNGTECKSCDIGAVMRKWRAKLEAKGLIK